MRKTVIGVMGGSGASEGACAAARRLGSLIAGEGWVLLNGGRARGIMDAAAAGARENGGLTMGILPGDTMDGVSEHLDIAVLTGMGSARNVINVLTSDLVVACPGGAGTLSEIALALKSGRKVVLLGFSPGGAFDPARWPGQLFHTATPEETIEKIRQLLKGSCRGTVK